jgi:hypothetical protein
VGLTRDSANEAIHKATPWAAREGSHIAPDRRLSHETLAHRLNQMGDGEGFPLHHADDARTSDCQLKPEIEAAASGAKADDVESADDMPGICNHIHDCPYRANSQSAARTWSFIG